MPYANNQGINIYYEVEGQGPPLMLGHGAMGAISMWRAYGYVDLLKDKYKLILIDSRGHGKSDKLYIPEQYHYKFMVEDVIAVLDDLGIEQTHYWGWSLNGFTAFGLAKHYPNRLLSLIIGGASPYVTIAPSESTEPDEFLEVIRLGAEEGFDAMLEGYRVWAGGTLHPSVEPRLQGVDFRAMAAMFEFSPNEPGLEDVLPTMTMPCLVYIGEYDDADHVLNYVKEMPNAAAFVLPGLSHGQTSAAIDLLVPRALEFLTSEK